MSSGTETRRDPELCALMNFPLRTGVSEVAVHSLQGKRRPAYPHQKPDRGNQGDLRLETKHQDEALSLLDPPGCLQTHLRALVPLIDEPPQVKDHVPRQGLQLLRGHVRELQPLQVEHVLLIVGHLRAQVRRCRGGKGIAGGPGSNPSP